MFSTYPVITLVTVLAIVLVVAYHLIGIFYNLTPAPFKKGAFSSKGHLGLVG